MPTATYEIEAQKKLSKITLSVGEAKAGKLYPLLAEINLDELSDDDTIFIIFSTVTRVKLKEPV